MGGGPNNRVNFAQEHQHPHQKEQEKHEAAEHDPGTLQGQHQMACESLLGSWCWRASQLARESQESQSKFVFTYIRAETLAKSGSVDVLSRLNPWKHGNVMATSLPRQHQVLTAAN